MRFLLPNQGVRVIATLVLLLLLSAGALADTRIAALNIERFGWGEKKDLEAVATVAARFDLLAVIELMRPEALTDLEQRLERLTGQEWASLASEAVGSTSYKEHYGFLWREDRIRYVDGAVVFIDTDDSFAREPFSARFEDRASQAVFALAALHILYGQSVRDRVPELHALAEYWDWLGEVYPDTPRILAGDFNIPPSHPALGELRSKAKPLIVHGATTLSSKDGRYANLYDNLWVEPEGLAIKETGIEHFPKLLGLSHEQARARVSDHAPVYLKLSAASATPGRPQSACINLNTASKGELQGLPHIGPARAEAIIQGRPWAGVADLVRISGIGTARMAEIRNSKILCD